ncbi:ketopantoate reductase family protein [Gorillibacterium massiliense]|uniref:ketopantoate reductase family protein n=1 Tax=Gorillibacterium massiliense TaxID=1280390 RepID=UPI0004B718F3|nr:2-dehydropantoate 2-reductase [Gorillibacterium massiliense]
MNIHIMGGGSLGLLLAGALRYSGQNPVLITRTSYQSVMLADDGLLLEDTDGGAHIFPIESRFFGGEDWVRNIGDFFPDWVFVALKQADLSADIIERLALYAKSGSNILCFQNGIGHLERIAERTGRKRLFAAVTTEGAKRISPRQVLHTGRGLTKVGKALSDGKDLDVDEENGVLQRLKEDLQQAGFTVELHADMKNAIWEKLLINAVINPLTGIFRIPNGKLPEQPERMLLMKGLYEEGKQVAASEGAVLPDHHWDTILEVCANTANNKSSMLQDIERNHKTEIEWISGELIRLAGNSGIHTPVTTTVYRIIRGLEPQNARPSAL